MPEWFEVHATFEAISFADAETVVDAIASVICRGHGEGEDHQCQFQFVLSGPVAVEDEMEAQAEDELG